MSPRAEARFPGPQVAGRNTCFDFDQDGDIEFPAGFYFYFVRPR